ncbi:MAG: NAD(P)/FAD-dependent oxidoreductase, partial [Acetobacteraceae bacterium]
VVGAGFGGLQAATALARMPDVELSVVDQHNHHLFQPLLYQVATAALSVEDIASPIRGIITTAARPRVLMDRVTGIDAAGHRVLCEDRSFPYDLLIVATGSRPSYFGNDEWRREAPGLKTLDDALALRHRILSTFEKAVVAVDDPAERERLLTFVLVGAGPTGVEMAGAIAELAQDMVRRDFHSRDRMRARIVLIEAAPKVLPDFPSDLSRSAAEALAGMGVEVRPDTRVTAIADGMIHCTFQGHDEVIAAETIIWMAGVAATPVAAWLGIEPDRAGRVAVGPDLRVPGQPDIYVIGDAALVTDGRGKRLPGVAPVAKQQGGYVARAIARRLRGRAEPPPFSYRDYGTLATIGRNKAVAEFGSVHLTGFVAWVTWAVAHIFFLIGFRNRLLVSAKWAFSYVTRERGARVIT